MRHSTGLLLAVLITSSAAVATAQAQTVTFRTASGYNALVAELGGPNTPTADGIVVGHTEAGTASYVPNTLDAEFSGKTFTANNAAPAGNTSHATTVGRAFYGNTISVAPGVTDIQSWRAQTGTLGAGNDWVSNFLHVGSVTLPSTSTPVVWAHPWIGQTGNNDVDRDALGRMDYSVNTHNYIHVVGIPNTDPDSGGQFRWFSDSMNAIVVGTSDGDHYTGTQNSGGIYTAGRTAPHVVAGITTSGITSLLTSYATGYGAGSAAFLVDTAQETLVGAQSTNAQRAETIKATMMAGADRSSALLTDGAYTVNTTNGLNSNYGAGFINVYNGYHIIAAGEQDAGNIAGQYGFDYNPAFSYNPLSPNDAAAYTFQTGVSATDIFASLVWNADVPGSTSNISGWNVIGPATLNNLNLSLYDITNGGNLLLTSSSTLENTENIMYSLAANNIYELRVTGAGLSSFTWDYSLAWRATSAFVEIGNDIPEPASLALLASASSLMLLRRRRTR